MLDKRCHNIIMKNMWLSKNVKAIMLVTVPQCIENICIKATLVWISVILCYFSILPLVPVPRTLAKKVKIARVHNSSCNLCFRWHRQYPALTTAFDCLSNTTSIFRYSPKLLKWYSQYPSCWEMSSTAMSPWIPLPRIPSKITWKWNVHTLSPGTCVFCFIFNTHNMHSFLPKIS